jgi:hypothetical protein
MSVSHLLIVNIAACAPIYICTWRPSLYLSHEGLLFLILLLSRAALLCTAGMKTDRIRMDMADITFVFIFLVRFGFEYG